MTQQAPAFKDGAPIGGLRQRNDFLPNTTDWLGRWRLAANVDNDWHIDWATQRNNAIYSGIESIYAGSSRHREHGRDPRLYKHLAPSDQMITRTRRRLLMAARASRDNGLPPPGVENVEVFRHARGGYFVSDDSAAWQDAYAAQLALACRAPSIALRAVQ
jgi:phthalate 4,5-dioxygenase